MDNTYKKTKTLNLECITLYSIFIIYFGINPMVKLLNYIGIPINIKSEICFIILIVIYFVVSLIKGKVENIKNYLYEWILLVLITAIYLSAYSYVKDYSVIQFYNGKNVIFKGDKFFFQILKAKIMLYWVFAILGVNIKKIYTINRIKKIKYINKLIYLIIFTLIFYISFKKGTGIFGLVFNPNIDNSYYLYIGDALSVFAIMIYSEIKYKKLFLISTVILLYKIGSRTSFMLFIAICIFLIIRKFYISFKLTYKKLLIIFSGVMIIGGICVALSSADLSGNRMLSMFDFDSIENDSSLGSREKISKQNLNDLPNIWFKGRVFREVELYGLAGRYNHDILSYWIEYGIIPFILISISLLILIYRTIKSIKHNDNFIKVCNMLFVFYLPMVLFSRSYVYPYLWLLIFMRPSLIIEEKSYINEKI